MPQAVLLACLLVLVLLVVFLVWRQDRTQRFWLAHVFETPAEKIYKCSDGTFDAPARAALARAGDDATARDHALAASILTHNVLALEDRGAGGVSPERRAAFADARHHYIEAVRGARELPHRSRDTPGMGDMRYVLDEALIFATIGAAEFAVGAPREEWEVWDMPLMAEVAQTREVQTAARQEQAAEAAAATAADGHTVALRGAQADVYTQLAVEHRSDSQNVHDSAVNAALRAVVTRLRAEHVGALPSIAEVRAEITTKGAELSRDPRTGEPRPYLVHGVLAVMDKVHDEERNIAIDLTDEEAIRLVWARANHPRNAAVGAQIKQAIFDELSDARSQTTGRVECVNGRTGRVLASLVLLDWDERNWELKKLEDYRNEAFKAANQAIHDFAAAAAADPDPERRRLGLSYTAHTAAEAAAAGEFDEETEAAFRAEIVAEVGRVIDAYVLRTNSITPGAIPAFMVAPIKAEAQAGVP
jgi:hypothetical protein